MKSVLIVEDAKDILILLNALLAGEGYDVNCASNGKEALDLLRASKTLPGVILLDLSMPVMDGYLFRKEQACDARLAGIPVIVMTAASDKQSKEAIRAANAVLKKPFPDTEIILETVAGFFRS